MTTITKCIKKAPKKKATLRNNNNKDTLQTIIIKPPSPSPPPQCRPPPRRPCSATPSRRRRCGCAGTPCPSTSPTARCRDTRSTTRGPPISKVGRRAALQGFFEDFLSLSLATLNTFGLKIVCYGLLRGLHEPTVKKDSIETKG